MDRFFREGKSMGFFSINGKVFRKVLLAGLFVIAAAVWYSFQAKTIPVFQAEEEQIREITIVTNEIAAETEDGKKLEVYRWDPGTIYVRKGEKVRLRFFGIKGEEHSFMIEGTDVQGTIKKGKETVITARFDKKGIYPLICITHHDHERQGPMVAYIVVD
jgi:plastocyanin